MDLRLAIVALATILINLITFVSSETCTREVYGDTRILTCPRPNIDSRDKVFCCGPKKLRYCCSSEEFSQAMAGRTPKQLNTNKVVKNTIGVIVGVLVSAIVLVVIVVVISCFCCSCCLLARRRKRGHVYGPATTTPMTAAAASTGDYPGHQMNAYPQQKPMDPYGQQQAPPPAYPNYPPPQQQPQPYPPQQGYPPQPQAGGYPPTGGYQGSYPPVQGGGAVPPPYPMGEPNQHPYNPGY